MESIDRLDTVLVTTAGTISSDWMCAWRRMNIIDQRVEEGAYDPVSSLRKRVNDVGVNEQTVPATIGFFDHDDLG